jgi:protein ImuA
MRFGAPNVEAPYGKAGWPVSASPRWQSHVASLDAALSGGFSHGHLHEFYAGEPQDMPAATGFALALISIPAKADRPVLWLRSSSAVRQQGVLQANGWAEMGATPDNLIFGVVADAKELLKAGVDALRSNALNAVVAEIPGRFAELDMIASRRLVLAAEKSGTALFLIRADTAPTPSAAATRWRISSAPSRALSANAPGLPVFDIELLRQRSGPSGMRWQLEWDRDRRVFIEAAASGALVSAPLRRPAAAAGTGPARLDQRAA